MVNIAEITYGPNVYSETKTELDLYHKFNFNTKNFEDKKINFWSKNKIINNTYLR
jgi:hypothetical protein